MRTRFRPAATRRPDPTLEPFRGRIGQRVVFVPHGDSARGAVEHGVIAAVDHRMVYVDYGYPNPVWAELGNWIATHPANLRLETTAVQGHSCRHCGAAASPEGNVHAS